MMARAVHEFAIPEVEAPEEIVTPEERVVYEFELPGEEYYPPVIEEEEKVEKIEPVTKIRTKTVTTKVEEDVETKQVKPVTITTVRELEIPTGIDQQIIKAIMAIGRLILLAEELKENVGSFEDLYKLSQAVKNLEAAYSNLISTRYIKPYVRVEEVTIPSGEVPT